MANLATINNNLLADSGIDPLSVVLGTGTANQITYWVDADNIGALSTATYPSLTELSYVKGVTSSIQTQLDGKQPSGSYVTLNTAQTITAFKAISFANAGTYALTITNTSATGYGIKIIGGNDSNDSLRISNAADTADTIRMYGSGNAIFDGSVTASYLYLGSSLVEQLTISGTGSRGIGIVTNTSGDPYVRFYDNATIKGDIYWDRANNYVGINSITNGTTVLNEAGGGVAIATTSLAGYTLNVAGSTQIGGSLMVNSTSSAFSSTGAFRLYINRVGTDVGSIIFSTGGASTANGWAEIGMLSADGDLYFKTAASAGGYTTAMLLKSDQKIRFNAYGTGAITGTVAYNLAVDSSGNVIETAGGVVDGSGTANYIPRWQDANTITNSLIYDNGTNIGINTTSLTSLLTVLGAGGATNGITYGISNTQKEQTLMESRTVGLASGSTTEVCSIAFDDGAGYIEINLIGHVSSDSVSAKYILPVQYANSMQTNNVWLEALPISSRLTFSGELSIRLDIKVDNSTTTIRLRRPTTRTQNSVYTLSIKVLGNSYTYTSSSTTATGVSAPGTFYYGANMVMNGDGYVGINKNNPQYSLDVTGDGRFTSNLTASISALATASNAFVVSDGGMLKFRTAAQVLSDIGAQAALTNPVTGTGTAGQVAYWSSSSAITGESNLFWDASNDRLGIAQTSPNNFLHITSGSATVGGTQITLESATNGYGAGFNAASRTSAGGTLVQMGKVTFDGEGLWNTTASTQDAYYSVYIAKDGTLNQRQKIDSDGVVSFPAYTTNGFVKFSGSTGALVVDTTTYQSQLNGTGFVKASGTTISYDNTSYLPLTGGTLSGPLTVNAASSVFSGSSDFRLFINRAAANVASTIIFTTGGGVVANGWVEMGMTDANGDLYIKANPSAGTYTTRMLISGATGAATFYNTVTATAFYVGSSTSELITISGTGSRGLGVVTTTSGDPYVRLYDSTTIKGDIYWSRASDFMGINSTNRNTVLNESGGNVGIKSTSPQTKLQVDAASATTSSTVFTIYGSATGFSGANDANTAYSMNFDGCSYKGSTGIVARTGAQIQMVKSGSWNEADVGTGTRASLVFKTNNGTIDSPDLSTKLSISPSGTLQMLQNVWLQSSAAALIRDSYFGYSTGYRVVQIGVNDGTHAISLGADLTGNAGGSFSGHEIVIPNNKGIIAANAANNNYYGIIKATSGNGINIGGDYTVSGWIQIDSAGSVGIGTAPSHKLHVYGASAAMDGQAGSMRFYINRPSAGSVGSIIFTTNGANVSNGWCEIGQVDANGDLYLKANSSAASYNTRVVIKGDTGYSLFGGWTTSQGSYVVQVNGSTYSSSGFFEASDIRLKTIINRHQSFDFDAIEYNWNDGRDSKLHWGYAAQEVMNILPDAVSGSEEGHFTLDYNQVHTYKIAMLEKRIIELEQQLKNKTNENN